MKQILYIPTGELVKFLKLKGSNEATPAGDYVSSGQFKEEFAEFDFWDDSIDPFELIIKFLLGEVKDGEDLIFGEHVYEYLNISPENVENLLRSEFEIIETS